MVAQDSVQQVDASASDSSSHTVGTWSGDCSGTDCSKEEKRKVKDIKDNPGSSGIAIGDPGVNGNRGTQSQSGTSSSEDSSASSGSRKEVKEFHPAEDQLKAAPRH